MFKDESISIGHLFHYVLFILILVFLIFNVRAISMLMSTPNIQPVKANGTIYIRADGNVEPDTAPISSFDNITYTFTGNINDNVVIERDNIVVEGAGYVIQSPGWGTGIDLSDRRNVTITHIEIYGFEYGISLDHSSYNTLSENNITNNRIGIWLSSNSNYNSISGNSITENNGYGIYLEVSSNNSISGNNIANNSYGIWFWLFSSYNSVSENDITNNQAGVYLRMLAYAPSSNNTLCHNNFTNNHVQVESPGINTTWDAAYPSGGNFWSDYNGVDLYGGPYQNETGSDGIGDTPYVIDGANQDRYPLVKRWIHFDTARPVIQILSPQNMTYVANSVPLDFTVDEPVSWVGYSLDGQANVTIGGNASIVGLSSGEHSVVVYANDSSGNMGRSEKIYFTSRFLEDLNMDGKIDILDMAFAAMAFGSFPEFPRWNPMADINQDGNVNMIDMALIAKNFGRTYP